MRKEVFVTELCLTLRDPMDCSPPGSSVHGVLQARTLEWVAIPFSRGSSWPRDQTQVSCTAGGFLTLWSTREAQGTLHTVKELGFNGGGAHIQKPLLLTEMMPWPVCGKSVCAFQTIKNIPFTWSLQSGLNGGIPKGGQFHEWLWQSPARFPGFKAVFKDLRWGFLHYTAWTWAYSPQTLHKTSCGCWFPPLAWSSDLLPSRILGSLFSFSCHPGNPLLPSPHAFGLQPWCFCRGCREYFFWAT